MVGDIHRMRVIEAFEHAGVPLEALVAARRAGRVSFDYYDELHVPPSTPSDRTYEQYRVSLGEAGTLLPMLFDAFGLVEPTPTAVLDANEEAFIAELLDMLQETGRPEAAMRAVRLFAEANRQAAEAALGVYAEVVAALGDWFRGLPPDKGYAVLRPWARIARTAPTLAGWLATKHMSHAIDAYSAVETERTLEELGLIPERPAVLPGIAFVDLTGFTRLSEEAGDETAAGVSLRLGELARATAARHGGRVVKLLGDGVLLQIPRCADGRQRLDRPARGTADRRAAVGARRRQLRAGDRTRGRRLRADREPGLPCRRCRARWIAVRDGVRGRGYRRTRSRRRARRRRGAAGDRPGPVVPRPAGDPAGRVG